MLATALKVLLVVVVAYVGLVALAWRFQERIAFPGVQGLDASPQSVGLADGERVEITTSDGVRLVGWYLPPSPPQEGPAPGLLWFYGNAETLVHAAPSLAELRPHGVGVFAIDYRGYGQSAGRTTERGLYLDGSAAWDFLASRADIDSSRIAVYGRSLGSAVALYLAVEKPVRAVILDSPFTSARAMARQHYPLVPRFGLRLRLENERLARRLRAPLLVFHGTRDTIVPVGMGEAVAQAGRAEEFVRIAGAGHNDIYDVGGSAYRERLHAFLLAHVFSGPS